MVVWSAPTEVEEAGWIANLILDLADKGVRYRDIAVLVRSRAAYPRLVEQFATFGIPVQPGGRSGLFDQPEAVVLGHTFAWLSDIEWRDRYGPGRLITDAGPARRVPAGLRAARRRPETGWRGSCGQWKAAVPRTDRPANLIAEFYELLDELNVRSWDLVRPAAGEPARYPRAVLRRCWSTTSRSGGGPGPTPTRPASSSAARTAASGTTGTSAIHIINYAQGAYEGFDGEADFVLNAVDLTTVHRAKGLEWPAVFVPSMTAKPVPQHANRPGTALARAARSLQRRPVRGKRRQTSGACSTSR